jgi:hypothetical protein
MNSENLTQPSPCKVKATAILANIVHRIDLLQRTQRQ